MDALIIICETFKTPFGQLAILARQSSEVTVVGAGFGPANSLITRVKATRDSIEIANGKLPQEISSAVEKWLGGDHQAFTNVVAQQIGTSFRQECWSAMRQVNPGETISYAELAQKTSSPTAVRAAATACAQNLIAPIIPCHRIIKTDGSLGRYGFGAPLKARLLAFEGLSL